MALDLLSSAVNHDVWFRTEVDTLRKTLGPSNDFIADDRRQRRHVILEEVREPIEVGRTKRVCSFFALHTKMDYPRHLEGDGTTKDE